MSSNDAAKTAVITGAASGIGRCAVERLVRQGWDVWALDNDARALCDLTASAEVHVQPCDVADPSSVATAFATISAARRKIDALICSAGVVRVASLIDQTPEDADLMLRVNVIGPWLTVRAAVPLLRARSSVDDPSRVVVVGSIGGIRPKVGTGFYSATKSAVHVLTGVLAVELAPLGILVNAVAPGTVATPMAAAVAASDPASGFRPSGTSPLGRIAQPDDVVDVIDFYLGDAAKYVSGTVLPVDGGTRAAFVMR